MSCNAPTKSGKPCRMRAGQCPHHQMNEAVLHFGGQSGVKGGGLFSAVKKRINALYEGPKNGPSGRLEKLLDQTQGHHITKIELCRKPVLGPVQKALDVMSFGKFSAKKKELGYDEIWHNSLLIHLDDGRVIKVEKNHVVEAKPASKKDFDQERMPIPVTREMSLKDMIAKASADDGKFWRYSAAQQNCQQFTADMLVRNGLVEQQDKQDAQALVDTIPAGEKVTNTITDAAAVGDRLLHGDGIPPRMKNY